MLRADTSRMAVVGDSAGGNLAAVVAQVLRDHGIRLRLQALVYPSTDLTMSSPSRGSTANARLTQADMEAFREHYAPPGADLRDPSCCRRSFGRLEDLPRRWCRRPTSTRSGTTASGMPPRCAGRACRCGSRTTWGSRTASPALPG